MDRIVAATVCAAVGFALVSTEASAQSQSRSQYRQGAPGEYHIYRAPSFETSPQPTTPRQTAPQNPSQQTPYSTYSTYPNNTRPVR